MIYIFGLRKDSIKVDFFDVFSGNSIFQETDN